MAYAADIHEHFTEKIIKFLPIERLSGDIEDTKHFIKMSAEQRVEGTDLVWVILYNNKFTGVCGIHTLASKKPHFGIWIKAQEQGKGIGKKVVDFVLRWGAANLNIEYISYPVDKENTRSIKLIESLNLQCFDQYQIGTRKKMEIFEYRYYK